jgi:hypothetical protein
MEVRRFFCSEQEQTKSRAQGRGLLVFLVGEAGEI